ncbi:MAG: sporulation protein YunB [Clostridia bacterium]|nr:sporulation protein YunB [Clostridia bacterium]
MSYYMRVTKHSAKRRKIVKRLIAFAVVILIVVTIVTSYSDSARQVALDYANAQVFSITANAVNDAVYSVMSELCDQQLVTVLHNSVGDVVLLQANSAVIGKIAKDTAKIVEDKINSIENLSISIPIGTLSGVTFFIGSGPKVKFSVEPIGSVACKVYSQFESAGINQTLHKIYLEITSKVDVVLPNRSSTVTLDTPVLLTESILVGKIPDTYLNGMVWGSN